MKLYLASILFILSFFLGNGQAVAEHYQTEDFDVAIFSKEYELYGFGKRFTPAKEEIAMAEQTLKMQLKEINKNQPNQSLSPVIHKNLKKYKRQYIGFYDENGKKCLLINFFWSDGKNDDYWLNDFVQVEDGGSYYWQIKYSVDDEQLFDLSVNGWT
ncbi:MAG: hypothetical protein WCY16_09860 [Weeksellaceae bacterium]